MIVMSICCAGPLHMKVYSIAVDSRIHVCMYSHSAVGNCSFQVMCKNLK